MVILCAHMNDPVINLDEPIGKWVGRRKLPQPLDARLSTRQQSEAWRAAFGGVRLPKGVYRFKTHEEANEWELKMMTRAPKAKN